MSASTTICREVKKLPSFSSMNATFLLWRQVRTQPCTLAGIFSAGASLSGAVDVAEICEAQEKNGVTEAFDVMGEASKVRGSNNDLFALCENFDFAGKTAPRLFMCCGTEDMLYWQNVRMRNHIKGLPFDLTYEEEPGTHNWAYWDMKIQSVLKWLNIGGEA